ncbi:hypothetical protein QF035_009121 [Streptomyces umbrinus]|uniref:ATP-dependent DNA ligase family profile domain-containing protein n=1 Tax=Streptomyces umbrinus TaxID=67370 RepID=A0ABU0T9S4_9ACTN|nr:hypothetical protein [Streptomyces umbrinus]
MFLQSRNLRDLTAAFPEIAEAAVALGEDVVIDGEAVIHIEGRLDFGALQRRTNRRPRTVAELARQQPAHLISGVRAGSREPTGDRESAFQQVDRPLVALHSLV